MARDGNESARLAQRARDWYRASQAIVCDVIEPWRHGTVVRATRYPTYYNYNLVRVEDGSRLEVAELTAFADRALDGLAHRKLDFERIDVAEAQREALCARGWKATRLLWMRHRAASGTSSQIDVETVDYDAVEELRLRWHDDDFPDAEWERYRIAAREVAMSRRARVLAVLEQSRPIAFAQLEWIGESAEVSSVYVHPDRRGAGLGTALTIAAIAACADARELWIVADDEDRPKRLYERLGFEPAWTSMEYLLLP